MRAAWSKLATYLFGALTALAFWASYEVNCRVPHENADQYYHLALAQRQARVDAVPRALPQVVGLGWDSYFPEKEFLFHQLTALAYRVGGEPGVLALVPILGALLFLLVWVGARASVGPGWAFAVTVACLALSPFFSFRCAMLRPHLWAVTLFVLLGLGLLRRNRWLVFAAGALFALSYHALYLPVVLLAIVPAIHGRSTEHLKLIALGAAGIALGTLVNPYFPSTLTMTWRHLNIAWSEAGGSQLLFGEELVPMRADEFVSQFFLYLAILPMAAAHLVVTATRWSALSQKERADTREYGFLLAAAVVFWALSSRNPRGAEYAIPLTALVLAAGLRQAPRARLVVPAVLALALAVQIPRMAAQVRAMAGPPNERSANALLALEAIPRQAGGLLFNCEWDLSPYVLYARPGLRFLDILDPSLLQTASPHLHQSRQRLLAGDVADPYFMLKGGLRADYVLCRSRAVVAQLQSDPLFVPLSPAAGQGSSPETPFLFKLAEVPGSSFVRDFEVTPPSSLLQEGLPDAQTAWAPLPGPPQAMPVRSADLGEYLRAAQASGSPSVVCAAVRPSATAVAQHAGKTLIGIGGGRNVRVWLNGEPFYASGTAFEKPRLVQQLAALPRPLTPADRIEAVVCSRSDASFLLLALSFWDQGEVDSICRAKGWTEPPAPKGGLGWRFRGNPAQTCLGPVAASGASAPQ